MVRSGRGWRSIGSVSMLLHRLPVWLRLVLFLVLAAPIVAAYTVYGRTVIWLGLLPFRRLRRILGSRMNRSWNRLLFGLVRWLGLLELEVAGVVPLERPLLVVSNHQSLLDIPVLHVTLGRRQLIRFVVKQELKWGVPNISPSCRFAGYAFVDRRRQAYARNLAELTRFARRLVTDSASGVIFPEGTWEPRGQPLPFRGAGLETILKTAPLAVLPVVLDGTWRAPGFSELIRQLGHLRIRVEIGELIPAAEAARDLEGLTVRLEREIHGKLAAMRADGS